MNDPETKPEADSKDYSIYEGDAAFHEFVDREFDLMAAEAPLEDLIIFAFGGWEEAIEAFEEHKRVRAMRAQHETT